MCGILGMLGAGVPEAAAERMLEEGLSAIGHRGPDHRASVNAGSGIFLAHNRLSILDTSPAGNQPMSDASGRYWLVFNGEIYNFGSLRDELLQKGHRFRSSSDTEVVLHAFIEWGEDCLQRFNGFFALAFCDTSSGKCLLARDRMGIKPLLYAQQDDRMIFGSELGGLMPLLKSRELDPLSLRLYLQLSYLPADHCMLKGVSRLEPGHLLEWENGRIGLKRWYRPETGKFAGSEAEAISRLRELLGDAVGKRLVSDVPLGCFLSGGIDSSVISMLAVRQKADLQTFSIGFPDFPHFNESAFAAEVAGHIGSRHHCFEMRKADLLASLAAVLESLSEPFADSSAIAVHLLSRLCRQEVTVSLSGDGADELFAGYNKHRAWLRSERSSAFNLAVLAASPLLSGLRGNRDSRLGNSFRQLQRYAEGLRMPASERYLRWCSIRSAEQIDRLLTESVQVPSEQLENTLAGLHSAIGEGGLNDSLRNDQQLILPGDMLAKVDLMSMASSLEVRVPFLDHRLVEFANSLPAEWKNDGSIGKKLLRKAYSAELPESVFKRPKHGFEVPLMDWFRSDLREKIESHYLADELIDRQQLFNPAAIAELKRAVRSGKGDELQARLWSLVVFQHWWLKYMD